jgi:deoxyhypusine synthase
MTEPYGLQEKLAQLSPALRNKIVAGPRRHLVADDAPVSRVLASTLLHCNGGKAMEAAIWLRDHCMQRGNKIFITMAGAGSSFELGIVLGELIRAGLVGGISVTGANLEESLYRLVANRHYADIPKYTDLTVDEEKELDRVGLRRITDTVLPEEESARVLVEPLTMLWREAEEQGTRFLWHEYFLQLFERNLVEFDPTANPDDCWLYQAWRHDIPIFVPGWEDSTMGNIFTWACYTGDHPFLRKYRLTPTPISAQVVRPAFAYMHALAEWYMDTTRDGARLAFVQLGGGIAADFAICVVPHLKKDFLADRPQPEQDRLIPSWAGFVEIHSSPMSYGSYSGAGGKEKITWSKLDPDAFIVQIEGDYTLVFPIIAAVMLGK